MFLDWIAFVTEQVWTAGANMAGHMLAAQQILARVQFWGTAELGLAQTAASDALPPFLSAPVAIIFVPLAPFFLSVSSLQDIAYGP